jgi:putative protease
VAEVLIEAAPLRRGERQLWMGETTGCVEQVAECIHLTDTPVEEVRQGSLCAIQTSELIRRGDKLYKMEPIND